MINFAAMKHHPASNTLQSFAEGVEACHSTLTLQARPSTLSMLSRDTRHATRWGVFTT